MGDLIKIVGVQYAVNSTHVKGEDMTAQEQQKTIEAQQKVIEELQTQNAEFEKRLNKLEKKKILIKD